MINDPNRSVAGGNLFDSNGNKVNIVTLLQDAFVGDDDLRAINNQHFWGFQKRYDELDVDDTIKIIIKAGTTKEMNVYLTIDAKADAIFDSYQESVITDLGEKKTVFNQYVNPGQTPLPEASIYENPTVSDAGVKRFEILIPAGGKFSSGGSGGLRTKTILAPDIALYLVITNKTANGSFGITLNFYE